MIIMFKASQQNRPRYQRKLLCCGTPFENRCHDNAQTCNLNQATQSGSIKMHLNNRGPEKVDRVQYSTVIKVRILQQEKYFHLE
jgi:hypothetical protein